MNDLAATFDELVWAEADDLADELRGNGCSSVDPVWCAVLIRERRRARESGHYAARRLPNGNVEPVWVPSPWEDFWRRYDGVRGAA